MIKEVLDVINKLDKSKVNLPLRTGGTKVEKALKDIQKRLPELDQPKQALLAILLQHQSLTRFTDQELKRVSELRLELLDNNVNETPVRAIKSNMGFYDTGSYRVNTQLAKANVNSNHLNYLIASRTKNIERLLLELIS